MTRRTLACTAAAVIGLSAAGCGGSGPAGPDDPPRPSVDPAAVAWANQVCEAVQDQAGKLAKVDAPASATPSPAQVKAAMVAYLGTLADIFTEVSNRIEAAGPPPVAGVSQVVERAVTDLDATQQAIEQANRRVQQLPTEDPAAFSKKMRAISKQLKSIKGAQQATSELKRNPKLAAAFDRATACR